MNNIEIVPNNGEEDEDPNNDAPESEPHIEGTTTAAAIIENIDSIRNNSSPNNNISNNNDDQNNLVEDDENISAAISDDTSLTSLASQLSDGISRPRSASLHINTTPSNNSNTTAENLRPRSIPRIRPRSNPRTRTPMRHESPLLVISPIVAGSAASGASTGAGTSSAGRLLMEGQDGQNASIATNHNHRDVREGDMDATSQVEGATETNNEQLIRNIFHTRNNNSRREHRARRSRAGSIPEEMVVDVVVEDDGDGDALNNNGGGATATAVANGDTVRRANNEGTTTTSTTTNNNATRAGRFFTQAVAPSTTTSSSRRRRNDRTNTTSNTSQQQSQRTLSTKQNPSHRKIRRWKNDAFIGTPSEHTHTMLIMSGNDNEKWNTFPYMPNHPLEYKSEFGKLSVDSTKGGERVRERFVRGEVASVDFALRKDTNGRDDGDEDEMGEEGRMYQKIVSKCRQLGISPKQIIGNEDKKWCWGKVLYDKLGTRIQSILSRSCGSVDTNASRIVDSFESYLISLALQRSKEVMGSTDDGKDVVGFPPMQSQSVYDVFEDILASPPRIVIREKQSSSSSTNYSNNQRRGGKVPTTKKEVSDMNKCGVLIPTVHFYFPTEGQDGSSRRSSAFHRILLYAVCQFHGLETSSFVVPEKKNLKKVDKNERRRRGQQKQTHESKGASMKVVTVQGGVLLAPSVKLLDYVCT